MISQEIDFRIYNKHELAAQAFSRVLQNVHCHPFVSEFSKQLRDRAYCQLYRNGKSFYTRSYYDVRNRALCDPPCSFPAAFLYGSVARGQASKDSDIDGAIIHHAWNFNRCVDPSLFDSNHITSHSLYDLPLSATDIDLNCIQGLSNVPPLAVLVFCPAVGEFGGYEFSREIEFTANQLRRYVIQAIQTPGESMSASTGAYSPHGIWECIRARLNKLLICGPHCRGVNTVDDFQVIKDRESHIVGFWEDTCGVGADPRSVAFLKKYSELSFPDWETMKLAFSED